jgi:hypothetical protein
MIVKILKPSAKFSGVSYSQKKIDEGKASFSGAFNFPFEVHDATHETFIAYLERFSDCAFSTIKNRQFHAIISTKGKEHDEAFLVDIAEKWMQKMGYGEQPYLIYFHGDTDNNHAHIVSSRVTKERKSINAYKEGIKGVKYLNDLMNKDLEKKASFDIQDTLANYEFSTQAQFKLILEQRGWKIREKSDKYVLFKNEICGDVQICKVSEKASKYKQNEERIKQLRAIFRKYSGLPPAQFKNFLRSNFGIELVFHTSKGHEMPYGYTVIDHDKKCVMKGGEILPVNALLNPKSRAEHLDIVKDILQSNSTVYNSFSELKSSLSRNGYYLKKNRVFIKGDDVPLLQLHQKPYKELLYNDRLKEANKFLVRNEIEAIALSLLLYVRARDIKVQPEFMRDDSQYREMVQSFANDRDALLNYLEENNIRIIKYSEKTLLVDSKNYHIADVSGLELDDYGLNLEHSYNAGRHNVEDMTELVATNSIIISFHEVLSGVEHYAERDPNEQKRKRRKKRKLT